MKPGPGSGPSIAAGGMIHYFNNLIMEKMRNENNEEIKTEDGHHGKHESSSQGPPISMPNMNLPGGSASHPHGNIVTSVVHGHPGNYSGLAGRMAAVAAASAAHSRDDHGPHSDHRGNDSQVTQNNDFMRSVDFRTIFINLLYIICYRLKKWMMNHLKVEIQTARHQWSLMNQMM